MVKLKSSRIFTFNMDNKIHCPRCSGLLKKKFMRKIRHTSSAMLDVCDNCGGMWLDRDEVKLLYHFSRKNKIKVKK